MTHENPAGQRFPSELLSRKEAAQYLGVKQQTLAVWLCTKRYNIPVVRIGRLVKYKKTDLDAFIHQQSFAS
jgi:excisionase family DNA binding protein